MGGYYYNYLFEVKDLPLGQIVKVFRQEHIIPGVIKPWDDSRSATYVGSYYSQKKRLPRGSCYNAGPSAFYERIR